MYHYGMGAGGGGPPMGYNPPIGKGMRPMPGPHGQGMHGRGPGMWPGPGGHMVPPQQHHQMYMGGAPVGTASAVAAAGAKRPPAKREMDSLLEELKAKQKMQDQRKEALKNAEARAAAAETIETLKNAETRAGAAEPIAPEVNVRPPVAQPEIPSPAPSAPPPVVEDGARRVVVVPPEDFRKRRLIDRLAKYVAQEGHHFEQLIMEKESPEGDFAFLYQHDSPENVYYRWRTFAFCQGDNFQSWRTDTFRICDGGAWWHPPPCDVPRDAKKRSTNFSSGPPKSVLEAAQKKAEEAANKAAAAEAKAAAATTNKPSLVPKAVLSHWSPMEIEEERERTRLEEKATQERQRRDADKKGIAGGKRLIDQDWDRLEQVLRNVTNERAVILEAMVFCMDKCDTAIEIAECITQSLTIVETDMSLKLARLLLVSDILHNATSAKPAAWAYRREFEKSLPDIIEHFHISLARLESRIGAEKGREQVMRILGVWEDWGLFAPQYVRGLEAALCVGVKSLRNLSARGDRSREPGWLEPKLADWRRQHFSQLEKMCRTRGMRSSTSHLEPTRNMSLEEVRHEWLIDRLACYELHMHEKEISKAAAEKAASAASKSARRKKQREEENVDGEEMDCGVDGLPLDAGDLDGEPLDIDDPVDLLHMVERECLVNPISIGLVGTAIGPGTLGGAGMGDGDATVIMQRSTNPLLGGIEGESTSKFFQASGNTDTAVGTTSAATEQKDQAAAVPPAKAPVEAGGGKAADDGDDLLDIERPEDPAALDPHASPAEPVANNIKSNADDSSSRIDRSVMRNIELEVMELRASLESQGLFRDAIEDICEEKRQRLIEEHEATLASPPFGKDGGASEEESESAPEEKSRGRESERDNEKERREAALAALKVKEDRPKEKDRDKERAKAKEKPKEREKERDREREKQRDEKVDRSRKEKEKEKEKSRGAKESEKAAKSRQPAQNPGRSRSRDRAKKGRR